MTHDPDLERAEPLFEDTLSSDVPVAEPSSPLGQPTPVPFEVPHGSSLSRRRFAGPGWLESLGWTSLMLLLQVVISVGFTAVAMVLTMAGGTGPLKTIPPAVEAAAAENEAPQPPPVVAPADPAEQLFQRSRPQLQRILPWLLAVVGLVNCTYALAASRFRLGLAEFRQLGWQLPSAQHLLLVLLMFVPLSMVCSTLQGWAIQWFPDSGRELAELFGALRHWPLPAVILILAVAPAIGEELLFRGLIGRGLLARHGWFWGMSITSLMFACVHLSPAQVIGVLPLGLVIHLIYATTRSFWAPMLAHFLNNALASVMLKLSDPTAAESAEASGETFDLRLVGLSAIALVFLGCWLWTTRVRFVNPSGVEWNPTEADCGVPASDGDFQREVRRPQVWQVAGSLAAVAALVWLGLQPS